jgi:hypothetical protein
MIGVAYWQDRVVDQLRPGDRMLLWCDGGPSMCRATTWPPPQEISEHGGMYVLVDEGLPSEWRYQFVPDGG